MTVFKVIIYKSEHRMEADLNKISKSNGITFHKISPKSDKSILVVMELSPYPFEGRWEAPSNTELTDFATCTTNARMPERTSLISRMFNKLKV